MTVTSSTIETFLIYNPGASSVPLDDRGLSVQVVSTLADLPRAQKLQYAAFIASEGFLVVWDDEPMNIVGRAENIEKRLTNLLWSGDQEVEDTEGKAPQISVNEVDPETGRIVPQYRPTHLMNTILVALTLSLITIVIGAGYRQVVIEIAVDKGYLRLAFLVLTPIQVFFTLVRSFNSWLHIGHLLKHLLVLRPGHHRLCGTNYRPVSANEAKLAILLSEEVASSHGSTSSYYDTMSSVQRELGGDNCTDNPIHQSSYFDIRAARRIGQYVY